MPMSIQRNLFNQLIKNFNFSELFIELGWDRASIHQTVKVKENNFNLTAAAEKRGFVILVCNSNQDSKIPNKDERKKIDRAITKLYYEHLIIYVDKNNTQQLWQLSIQEPNKPIQYREFIYYTKNEPEQLFEKLHHLFFTLDDEDKIGLVDVKLRVSEQFNKNAEKVTKKFYTEFKKHHNAFQSFIEGIENQADIDWYTSLMLNRLMFIYFIQKKGFLDGDTDYLSNKLKAVKEKKGNDVFYKSFYKTFLLTLFHQGLGKPNHTPQLEQEIGKIPYLNGGLFDVHQLEKDNDKLNIKDEAFEKLFAFFNEYNWHLDIHPDATGKDINPDVIGYIFEKYINDRAAMGAYYTKEDITEYIAKNTIIPFLFDRVKEKVKNAFAPDNSLWKMLKDDPDRYIYDAVKKGVPQNGGLFDDLPGEIKAGFRPDLEKQIVKETTKPHLWEIRKVWNKKAPENIALPTETYRELIERRKRYAEIKNKMLNDEITDINDFITYNLNIRQFAQDAVEQYEGSDFVSAFYNAIKEIKILDPTAGSGAFLFAALNILEPLYEACIARMREFVEIDDEKGTGKKHPQFRETLAEIEKHPNEKYYVFKNIILNNLYGVDIMNEAVEIAKLRLFLKLVAVVDPDENDENYGLEPLPDIDFNIRSGNTLVGFASYKEIKNAFEETEANGKLLFGEERKVLQKIDDQANIVADLFREFKKQQTINNPNSLEYKETKKEVKKRLAELNDLLNKYLALEYGINADDLVEQGRYKEWLSTHKPFHWFAEFYEIVHQHGGFDVIIGNPPYVVYNKKDKQTKKSLEDTYKLKNYFTQKTNNLYSFVIERSYSLALKNNLAMIIPLTSVSNNNMQLLRELLSSKGLQLFSHFEIRPSKLFDGVDQRLTIFCTRSSDKNKIFSTKIQRWNSGQRDNLFDLISYSKSFFNNTIWRISSNIENTIFPKYYSHKEINKKVTKRILPGNQIFYRTAGARYWIIFTNNGFNSDSLSNKFANINSDFSSEYFMAILNSNLYWWYYAINFDMFNIKDYMIFSFRNNYQNPDRLIALAKSLQESFDSNRIKLITESKTRGNIESFVYQKKKSKPIIDEIDTVLAQHYGFTEEELDFIINYDIKYRMGKEMNAYIEGKLGDNKNAE